MTMKSFMQAMLSATVALACCAAFAMDSVVIDRAVPEGFPEDGGGLLSTPQYMIKFFQMVARRG